MTYEPLHHKYRPQRFADLVGQGAIATTLTQALLKERIAPAYLFCGPRGTGKTSSARILAKSLNCLSHPKPTPDPCGQCEVCHQVANGTSLDVIEIDAASHTGVDNIRELIEKAQFAPVQCRYKVYVIDECLTGDALVLTQDGLIRIDDPAIRGKQALSYNDQNGGWEFKRVVGWLDQGIRNVLEIQTTHRRSRCTENHLIRTDQGWIAAREIRVGSRILSPAPVAPLLSVSVATDDRAALSARSLYPQWATSFETVVSVAPAGAEAVYDIEVEDNHNFVANGLLVHNCHMLSVSAFNALLKTLEEPPPHVVFVLATTDPQRVLPTIISRCQRFDFRRIPLGEMVAHLRHIADQEQIEIQPEALTLVAQLSQGGLRDAESLLDQLSLYPEQITVAHVWQLAGAVPEQDLRQLLAAIAQRDAVAVLEHTRQLLERGRDPLTILQHLASLYRDLLLAKTVPERQDLVALTAETWQALISLAEAWSIEEILQAQQHLRTCESQIKQSNQPRLWLEISLLGLMAAPPPTATNVTPTASPKLTIVSAPQVVAVPTQPSEPPFKASESPVKHGQIKDTLDPDQDTVDPTPQPVPSPELTAGHTEQVWQQALQALQQMQMSTYALLSQHGHLRQISDREVHIGIVNQTLLTLTKNNQAKIEAAFCQVLGRRIKVVLEVAPLPHKTAPAPKAKEPPQSAVVVPFRPREEPAPPPVEPPPAPAATAPDPVRESAEKLARFFNGVVIRLPDEGDSPDAPMSEASEEDDLEF